LDLIRRASFSLRGRIVLAEIFMSLPLVIVFIWLNHSAGVLTFHSALRVLFVASLAAFVFAPLFWCTVSKPLIRSTGGI